MGNNSGCCIPSFYFFYSSTFIGSESVHVWISIWEAGKALERKCRPTSWTEKGMFSSQLGNSPALLSSAPFASFYGENHPQHQRSHNCRNLWKRVEISIFQVLGQCPSLHEYSSFSLWVLDADSSSCKLWSHCLHLCSIFSEQIILSCPQSIFLQDSTCPVRSGLNPSINFSKDHQ